MDEIRYDITNDFVNAFDETLMKANLKSIEYGSRHTDDLLDFFYKNAPEITKTLNELCDKIKKIEAGAFDISEKILNNKQKNFISELFVALVSLFALCFLCAYFPNKTVIVASLAKKIRQIEHLSKKAFPYLKDPMLKSVKSIIKFAKKCYNELKTLSIKNKKSASKKATNIKKNSWTVDEVSPEDVNTAMKDSKHKLNTNAAYPPVAVIGAGEILIPNNAAAAESYTLPRLKGGITFEDKDDFFDTEENKTNNMEDIIYSLGSILGCDKTLNLDTDDNDKSAIDYMKTRFDIFFNLVENAEF